MEETSEPFAMEPYLRAETGKDLLRFSTAGSVDDGKSTLIGRLLLDSGNVYDDQVRAVEGKGTAPAGVPDLALLTDGLRAEREAGITIDVAYRYFSTARRRFILADTPGHEQYTRNMVTGVSTADAVVVLVDATRGVLPQTRRHASIAALLGVRHLVLAVNKMDCVEYEAARFHSICQEFEAFFRNVRCRGTPSVHALPVSALLGDGVVRRSAAMEWFNGPTLLDLLETLPGARDEAAGAPFRMAIQRVTRHGSGFRGYAGQIAAGTLRPGDRVVALPAGQVSRVGRIVTFDGDLPVARAPMSVTMALLDEIDAGRGTLLAAAEAPAEVASSLEASLVWMDETPLLRGRRYLLKHLTRTIPVQSTALTRRIVLTGEEADSQEPASLAMNEAAVATLTLTQPIAADRYADDRTTGSFILIDPDSNATVAAGMIERVGLEPEHSGPVTDVERRARFGHTGAAIDLRGSRTFAEALERALFAEGANVVLCEKGEPGLETLVRAGLLVLLLEASPEVRSAEPGRVLRIGDQPVAIFATEEDEVAAAMRVLRRNGTLHGTGGGDG